MSVDASSGKSLCLIKGRHSCRAVSPGYHATGDFNGLGCFEMGAKCNGLAGKPRMQAVDITVHLCFIEKQVVSRSEIKTVLAWLVA